MSDANLALQRSLHGAAAAAGGGGGGGGPGAGGGGGASKGKGPAGGGAGGMGGVGKEGVGTRRKEGRGVKRGREEVDFVGFLRKNTTNGIQDDGNKKPEMKLSIPEVLKARLVDDWEAVTKNNQVCCSAKKKKILPIFYLYHSF